MQTDYVRLIITGPTSYRTYQQKLEAFFFRALPILNGDYKSIHMFLSTGLPYHLPLSFSSPEAEAFAASLREMDCEVNIVPA